MKSRIPGRHRPRWRRSRKGAWIEMSIIGGALSNSAGRSRKGAWIETYRDLSGQSLEYGRSREGARIETIMGRSDYFKIIVAPARERGLKLE